MGNGRARTAERVPRGCAPVHRSAGLFVGLSILACATATYRPADGRAEPGYQDELTGPDSFKVVATGDGRASIDDVCEVALLRAAHIALEHGRDHFVVRARYGELSDVGQTTLDWFTIFLPNVGPFPVVVGSKPDPKPVCELSIELCPPWKAPPARAEDAHAIVDRLGRKLER